MKSPSSWKPTKFVMNKNGRLVSSPAHVSIGSQLIADLTADTMQQMLAHHARGVLLDLGCGNVPFYGAYKDFITESICMDWGNSLHKNPHIDNEHDISKPLPLADNSVDTVLLSDVLEHLPNPQNVMNEIYRVLKTDGVLIMNVPFGYWEHEAPHDYFRYTQYALRLFASTSGFREIDITPRGDGVGVIADCVAKIFGKVPVLKLIPMALNRGMFFYYKRCKKRILPNFPLSYFMTCKK